MISLPQLIAIGLSQQAVSKRVASGRLHRVHRGVFSVGHRLLSTQGRRLAAVLACGSGAHLSHRAAGSEWGIVRWSGKAEVLVPAPRAGPPGVIVRSSLLLPDEVKVEDGIPLTSPIRTLFDLASVLPPDRLLNAINEVDERQLWGPVSIGAMLERHRGERGAGRLRAVLGGVGYGIPRRELEEAFARFVSQRGLPRPHLNEPLRIGDDYFVADALWRERRLVVELHSARHHGTGPKISRDAGRDRRLLLAGWTVVHVTWPQLNDPREAAALARDLSLLLGISR